jgi:hypothetical protein
VSQQKIAPNNPRVLFSARCHVACWRRQTGAPNNSRTGGDGCSANKSKNQDQHESKERCVQTNPHQFLMNFTAQNRLPGRKHQVQQFFFNQRDEIWFRIRIPNWSIHISHIICFCCLRDLDLLKLSHGTIKSAGSICTSAAKNNLVSPT